MVVVAALFSMYKTELSNYPFQIHRLLCVLTWCVYTFKSFALGRSFCCEEMYGFLATNDKLEVLSIVSERTAVEITPYSMRHKKVYVPDSGTD